MFYSNKILFKFRGVSSQKIFLKIISSYGLDRSISHTFLLLTVKILYCVCCWFSNIFNESKKLSEYIQFYSTIVFWYNRIQEFKSSHTIIVFFYCCYYLFFINSITQTQSKYIIKYGTASTHCITWTSKYYIVCVLFSARLRRYVIIYNSTLHSFFALIKSKNWILLS